MITASDRLVRIPATICGSAAGKHDPPDALAPRDAVRARGVDERRVDAAHAVDRVQEDREHAEERDEGDLLLVRRCRAAGRSRSAAAPAAASPASTRCAASPAGASTRESPIGIPSATPSDDRDPEAERRSGRGSARRAVVNCENSHMSWNSTRIVDSRGKLGLSACTVHSCQTREDRQRDAYLGADRDRVVEPAVHAARPAATDASAARAARARPSRSGRRARGSRWRSRARTAGR